MPEYFFDFCLIMLTPIQSYRITSNFVAKRGLDRLKQFETDLNNGVSIKRIAAVLLHCSIRRAYILRDSIFEKAWVLKDSAREFVENEIKSEQCKIERAIKFSQHNLDNKKLKFILCERNLKKSGTE